MNDQTNNPGPRESLPSLLIIDAHAHLWLQQSAEVDGQLIYGLGGGRAFFMGEVRQMLPPYMTRGCNTAEALLANMDYAQVAAAVITQEYIDGSQNDYLREVQRLYPGRFLCCALVDARRPGFAAEAEQAVGEGFRAFKLPAGRLIMSDRRVRLTSNEMMSLFATLSRNGLILSVDLADGAGQTAEMEEVIAEYPSLKIAVGHFGMVNRPGWQEQIKLARHSNVMIESGGITWLFHNEFYPYHGAVKAIREAASLAGIEKLMWGSDYPRTMVAITYRMSYDFILRSDILSEDEKRLFLGANAQAFYGFGPLPEMPYVKSMLE
ncbi:MAG: amidohydrolase [Tannerellaceae bacterium]|jgi:predicted TIM-barrel fold metal-dependent hydrolase|nr:amidohydrolase [Tannerellaceae bacterium]